MSRISTIWTFTKMHRWKIIIALIVLLPIVAIAWYAFSPSAPSYVTEKAVRGDLRQIVDAVGTVISERDLQLQFPVSGIVGQVLVKEGDSVQMGQRLATVRAGSLAADIAAASARLQAAQADLRAREEGSTPQDIAVAEAQVQSSRASLLSAQQSLQNAKDAFVQSETKIRTLRSELDTSLSGQVYAVGGTVTREAATAQNALSGIRSVLQENEITDAIITQNNFEYQMILTTFTSVEAGLRSLATSLPPASFSDATLQLEKARQTMSDAATAANRVFALIGSLNETSYLSSTLRASYQATVATNRSLLQVSLNTLNTTLNALRDASASYETRIASEEASLSASRGAMEKAQTDIATYQAALSIAEAQLSVKRSPTRKTDLDIARANVRQAQASLQRSQADYANTVLSAPIAGRITKVNVKVGEAVPQGAAITLLGHSPFRIEMYVSEIDIPLVQVGQSGSVKLDAYADIQFALRVTDIDVAPTNRDGVNKYRVRLDFVYPHDELKIGMTGDVTITTGGVQDIVMVPIRAVLRRDNGTSYVRILANDGSVTEQEVTVGLEGEGSMVEVTNVNDGQTIIVLERT